MYWRQINCLPPLPCLKKRHHKGRNHPNDDLHPYTTMHYTSIRADYLLQLDHALCCYGRGLRAAAFSCPTPDGNRLEPSGKGDILCLLLPVPPTTGTLLFSIWPKADLLPPANPGRLAGYNQPADPAPVS